MADRGPRDDRDRGSTTVEVAVLLPLMMLLLMVVVQVGLWFHTRAVMVTAANKGVDAARAEQATAADGQAATELFLDHAGALRDPVVAIDRDTETVTVRISGNVVSVLFGVPMPVSARAEAPIEAVSP